MEWKKVVQWIDSMPPRSINIPKSIFERIRNDCFRQTRVTPRAIEAKNVLPDTITDGGKGKNFPNSPANPKSRTAP